MPGFELIGKEELQSIQSIFEDHGGVLFAHGFHDRRNGHFLVREFEQLLAKRFGVKYCQAVTSGTAAQLVALKAFGIKSGDEVITQAFTFVATVEAILECGAVPILVDVDETLNMCPKALEKALTSKTKCVIPVHMLGNPARMNEIMRICAQKNIPVFEDACEALGASLNGKPIGSLCEAGFFSLDFGKTITCGEGGFITTNNENLYKRMSAYHDHGHINDPSVPRGKDSGLMAGFNYRMSELQAAVGIAQLKKLDTIIAKNRAHKKILKDSLKKIPGLTFRELTDAVGELADTLMFFLPTAQLAEKVVAGLAAESLGTKNVPDAMNWHFAARWDHIWREVPHYANSYKTQWKKSEELLNRCVSLPVMVSWTEKQVHEMAEKIVRIVTGVLM